MPVTVTLDIDGPRNPEYTLAVAEAVAEGVRVLNHLTRSHDSIACPSEADRFIREIATTAARLPQLLGQVAAWLACEDEAGRIEIPSGENAGNPLLATVTACGHLEAAGAAASVLRKALDSAASVTSTMGDVED